MIRIGLVALILSLGADEANAVKGTSPTGRASVAPVVFVRGVGGELFGRSHLWRTRVNGSAVRLTSGVRADDPAWSPNGREIAYLEYERRPPGAGAVTHIAVVDVSGRSRRELTSGSPYDSGPSWSPDGRRIVFSSAGAARGSGDLFVVDRLGRNPRQLTRTPFRCEGEPDWSPDGLRILFMLCGTGDIYVMPAAGGRERLLVRMTYGATWSPNGASIAFSRADGIYLADADGRNERRVAAVYATDVDWSRDGGTLVYTADARDVCSEAEFRSVVAFLSLAPDARPRPRACVREHEWGADSGRPRS